MSTKIQNGNNTAGLQNVNADFQSEVKLANPIETNGDANPNKVGTVRLTNENDAGTITGEATLRAPYCDQYYRMTTADTSILDSENFDYLAQNTGKHSYTNTTMTAGWTASGLTTNSGNSVATTVGLVVQSRLFFPIVGNANTDAEMVASFSAQPTSNIIIDFGMFINGGSNPFAPTDGIYFRLTSAGLQGITNNAGIETSTGVFAFNYINNQKYRFYISSTVKSVEFWIDDILYAEMITPIAQGQPFLSGSLPFAVRHANVGGAAGAVINFVLNQYSVISGGIDFVSTLSEIGNRIHGSYQGLSGGTMGSLASYANNTNPTPAVPTNTTSTVITALGGQGWETDTLAVTTDGIIMSYQNPAHTVNFAGRRLVIYGVKIDSYIQTGLTGGGYNAQFSLCFGHTAVSLATGEAATTKAPRRIALGRYSVSSGAVALTQLSTISINFKVPIYVNPSEFVAIAKKKVGTAPSAGVIAYTVLLDYGWE
jgi:hypothetical protein